MPGRSAGYTAPVPRERTDSMASSVQSEPRIEWAIIVALDCRSLETWPDSFGLRGVTELTIARGAERAFTRAGAQARLELPDGWISESHARVFRVGGHWWIEDLQSRNGTRVNGERITSQKLGDGDVVGCGGTFLLLRRTARDATPPGPLASRPEALRSLSPSLIRELDALQRIARSRVPLLVLGESGTGKEGTVTAVHELSGRAGPLVAVNCGAIPPTLIESELFGSRRGAFSGAADRVGLVRTADGGTLFLDEVTELPHSSQAALLRVLQEKQILPLGTTRPIEVDVRIVAATNGDVTRLVEEGKLRRDLYARLRGYELRLPPLRDRLEDMGLLVATLIRRHDKSGAPRTLSREAAKVLFEYDWPLNIRELEQALSAAVALAGPEIGREHLPEALRQGRTAPRPARHIDREYLLALIARLEGNLSAVARELGTSRTQLYRLLARHSIQPGLGKGRAHSLS